MRRRTLLLAMSGSMAAGTAGCLGGGDDADVSEDAEVIEVTNDGFSTQRIEVDPGTTVAWENHLDREAEVASQTFDDGATEWEFDETIDPDSFVEHTFEDDGVYQFWESIMSQFNACGAVLVGDVDHDESMPCE